MGKRILYCSNCGVKLLEEDFGETGAVLIRDKAACAGCKTPLLDELTPEERQSVVRIPKPEKRSPRPAGRKPATVRTVVVEKKSGAVVPLVIVVAILIVAGIIVATLSTEGEPPEPTSKKKEEPTPDRRAELGDQVRSWLDKAEERQNGFQSATEHSQVLDAFEMAGQVAAPVPELLAEVGKRRREYMARFETAAEEAFRKCVSLMKSETDFDHVKKCAADYPEVFQKTKWKKTLDERVEEMRKSLGVGEWVSLFDGRSFKGWTRVERDGQRGNNWRIDGGRLVGVSSFKRSYRYSGLDDLVTDTEYTDFELEIEWTGSNDGFVGNRNYGLAVFPHARIRAGQRDQATGFVRSTRGRKRTMRLVVRGKKADLFLDERAEDPVTLNSDRGRICIALTPGVQVRIHKIRLKRLR